MRQLERILASSRSYEVASGSRVQEVAVLPLLHHRALLRFTREGSSDEDDDATTRARNQETRPRALPLWLFPACPAKRMRKHPGAILPNYRSSYFLPNFRPARATDCDGKHWDPPWIRVVPSDDNGLLLFFLNSTIDLEKKNDAGVIRHGRRELNEMLPTHSSGIDAKKCWFFLKSYDV